MNYWSDHPDEFLKERFESRFLVVHPHLRDALRRNASARVLDYGCGDGSLLALDSEFLREAVLYDFSPGMRDAARKLLAGDTRFKIVDTPDLIPTRSFDAATLPLVLMCLSTREEQVDLLRRLFNALRPGGILLTAITHPCFRAEEFSTFETEYTQNGGFDYKNEGKPFTVEIYGRDGAVSAAFQDYHWTLETTLAVHIEAGFHLENFAELNDKAVDPFRPNPHKPPYIVLTWRRG